MFLWRDHILRVRPCGRQPSVRHRWAAGEFADRRVADVAKVGDTDLASVEAVAGKAAQKREESHALAERSILLRVFPEGDEIQNFFLLFRRALRKDVGVTVGAETIEPEEPAAELQLIFGVLAGEQVNEFRRAGLDRAAGFFVLGNDEVAQSDQRGVVRDGKIFRSIFPCRRRSFLFVHHLVDVLGGLRRNHLQHRPTHRSYRQRPQDIASCYAFIRHVLPAPSSLFVSVLGFSSLRALRLEVIFSSSSIPDATSCLSWPPPKDTRKRARRAP